MLWKRTAAVLAISLTMLACSHRVAINSNPPGARTYVDNQFIGVTPTTFVEKSGMGKEYQIRLEKEGYRTLSVVEKQRINLIYLLFAPFTCMVGILWSFTLEDQYDYSLERG